jgi:hypothetical protein
LSYGPQCNGLPANKHWLMGEEALVYERKSIGLQAKKDWQ